MFHAYWLISLTTLEDCQGTGYKTVEDAILDSLEMWHEDESQPLIIIRACEDGPIVATIVCDPNNRNKAIVTRYCVQVRMVNVYLVQYVLNDEGQYVSTSIEEIS